MKKLLIIAVIVLSFAACRKQMPEQGAMPALNMPTLSGQVYGLTAAAQQRPVVIASMAGFCGYCKMMAPLLDKLAEEFKGKDVDFVMAFVDEKPEGVRQIAEAVGIKHAKVAYNAGEAAMALGVEGFPAIFLVRGNQVEEWYGYSPNHIEEIRARLK